MYDDDREIEGLADFDELGRAGMHLNTELIADIAAPSYDDQQYQMVDFARDEEEDLDDDEDDDFEDEDEEEDELDDDLDDDDEDEEEEYEEDDEDY
jgi:hypothetical protein